MVGKIKRRLESQTRKKVIETKRTIMIYDYFSKYPEDLIDKAIEQLTDKQKNILKARYGEDLKNPEIKPHQDNNAQQRFYNTIKRISTILNQAPEEEVLYISTQMQEESNNDIKYFYDNIYYLNVISNLPINESAIIFLRRKYNTAQIAEALNLSEEEVVKISKKALFKIKETYNNLFDSEIELIEKEQEKMKTK